MDLAVGRGGRTAATLPGFPDPGHPLNLAFASGGTGIRIQPVRTAEARQLKTDEFAVHERTIAFGDAVLALLAHHHPAGASSERRTGRLRGAGQWVGREKALVAPRPAWPAKLNAFQAVTVCGLSLLLLVCAALPLTFANAAGLLSYFTLAFTATGLLVGLGGLFLFRASPKLLRCPGWRASLPGIVAGLAAIVVWQVQEPLASHFFAGPYERQYSDGCLAASPYRTDAIQSQVNDGTLVVTPISGETTLRLGPAEDHGTHPLRPLDQATGAVLARYGC